MKKLIALFSLLHLNAYALGTDTAILSSILSQATAQLSEMKNILEIQSTTLDQVEKMNTKVQQTRYRLLRAKYLVESSQNLTSSNIHSSQEVLRLMRNAKNIKNNTVTLAQDQDLWFREINNLSAEEKARIVSEIENKENELKKTSEYINSKKLALHLKKQSNHISNNKSQDENKNLEMIIQQNEHDSASDLSQQGAASQTAKNTGLTNTILYKKMAIESEILKESQGINNKLEKLEIEKMERENRERNLWKLKEM